MPVVSHPPRRFIGPPDWLAPQWGVTGKPLTHPSPLTPHEAAPQAVRTRMTSLMFAICSCDYRGPVVESGCQCSNVCWLGRGQRKDGEGYGRVKMADCGECMRDKREPEEST